MRRYVVPSVNRAGAVSLPWKLRFANGSMGKSLNQTGYSRLICRATVEIILVRVDHQPKMLSDHRAEPDQATTDADLVLRAQGGDLSAFEALVSRHERRVYHLARRILPQTEDAEDVTQQAFLGALEHLNQFRAEASFSTWLLKIATHAALKILRKRKGLPTVSLEATAEEPDNHDSIPHPEYIADWKQSPEELVHRKEIQRLLDDALDRLDEKHRMVFLLRDMEGFSIRETAEAMGLSEPNVKVRLLRARLQLREHLTQALGDPATRMIRSPHAH